jgi:hypothetical protein
MPVAGSTCDLKVESPVLVQAAGPVRCSPPTRGLSPGDSAWAEQHWQITRTPGTYSVTVAWLQAGFAHSIFVGEPDRSLSSGDAVVPPRLRVPIVVRFENESNLQVTEHELLEVIHIELLHSGFLGMIAEPAAARAMTDVAPYLDLSVVLRGRGAYEFTRCWIGSSGRELSKWCHMATRGLTSSSVAFGALLAEFIRRELELRRHLQRD